MLYIITAFSRFDCHDLQFSKKLTTKDLGEERSSVLGLLSATVGLNKLEDEKGSRVAMRFCPFDNVTDSDGSLESSCCLDYETSIDIFYRGVQALHVVTGVLGIYFSLHYIVKYSSKHFLPQNIKAYLWITLGAIIVHSITLTAIHALHLVQSLLADENDPCSARNTVAFCAPFRYSFAFCVFILVLNQYMMYIDRLLDNFCPSYKSAQNCILASLLTIEFPLAAFIVLFVFRGAVSTEALLSCLNVPLSSMVDVSIATAAILPLNCICLVMSVLLFQTHQRKITLSRFDVTRHFKATMNRDALWFMRTTTITQAVIIVLYPILVLTVRFTAHQTPRILNKTLATLVYIFNWYCVLVPLVMIYAAKQTRTKRRRKIDSVMEKQVFGEEGSEYYFALLKDQWQQKADTKS
ncbi:integral membrane protein [Ostertagia ostertagi]